MKLKGYLYDNAGFLTQDDISKYLWNQQGQLNEVQTLTGSTIATYTYHPNGLRKSKIVGATTYITITMAPILSVSRIRLVQLYGPLLGMTVS